MSNILTSRPDSHTKSLVSLIALLIFFPLLLIAAYQTVTLLTRAIGKPANIAVDVQAVLEPIRTDWFHAFAQGGEESTDMLAPVVTEIIALRPKLIRIDHLYDHYDVVGRSGSDLTFDWNRLDQAVGTILSTGARPVLVLSYMPGVIARDGNITNLPNNWDEWALVVQKTIEHFSGKSDQNLSGVYYEVWNEPDLGQFGGWKLTGEKNYLTLYQFAAVGAKKASNVNYFYLGGPATTGLYKNWILALVRSGNRLNFLSWHSYLANPSKFDDDQRNIISWLLPYPHVTLIPKLITEFGFTGNKNGLYNTRYSAAYTAAVIRQLISGGPSYLFSFELKDGPNQEDGGWGLIGHESSGKSKKPRYFVYNFLDAMAGNRLGVTGEGSWVTGFASTKNGVIRLMLVNFDPGGNHVETVPVTFTNVVSGTYAYQQKQLFGQDTRSIETVTTSSVTKKIYMPAQSIVIIELSKQ